MLNTSSALVESDPKCLEVLSYIKGKTGKPNTTGLTDSQIERFLGDHNLLSALNLAKEQFELIYANHQDILEGTELAAIKKLQEGFLNFYATDSVSPYIPLVAKGPWVITCYGAVVYDTGSYGMLGFGHDPECLKDVLTQHNVMANIMTPNFAQVSVIEKLKKEIGRNRKGVCPYEKFLFLNSGSESMTVGLRIADLNSKILTDPNQKYAGWEVRLLALKGSFHGRTDRPARVSNSCFEKYQYLNSFRNYKGTDFIEPNNLTELENIFKTAYENKVFYEAFVFEPVMGEGNPGNAITAKFYELARKLTEEMGTLILVDSIQAGFRTQGVLSVTDYPEFNKLNPPDMESYSKAINGGQFPVSILALNDNTAKLYKTGVYGNTMTANPRALQMTARVLDNITLLLRDNIVLMGREFLNELVKLKAEFPDKVLTAQGTGLLLSCELNSKIKTVGKDSVEDKIRRNGVNVIHGGKNALRFTPYFYISTKEIELILEVVKEAITNETI
jgi:acetylornithine/succinyldiaminopimelate/putrescine aminotransferase